MEAGSVMERLGAYDMYPSHQLTEAELAREASDVERIVGWPLPSAYRAFVIRFGQFGFDRHICCPSGEGYPSGKLFPVSRWFGLRSGKPNTLRKEIATYRGRIPDHAIPVAGDQGGNLLVLALAGDDLGYVYSWDHEFRALGWKRLERWTNELEGLGVDVSHMASPQIIREWERRHPEKLKWKPGYGNLYPVARSWAELMASFQEYPE